MSIHSFTTKLKNVFDMKLLWYYILTEVRPGNVGDYILLSFAEQLDLDLEWPLKN